MLQSVLAFDSSGQLYGSILGTDSGWNDLLVLADQRTGAATIVGDIGFQQVYGLAFLPDGRLIGAAHGAGPVSALIQIDTRTGSGTAIAECEWSQHSMFGLAGGFRRVAGRPPLLLHEETSVLRSAQVVVRCLRPRLCFLQRTHRYMFGLISRTPDREINPSLSGEVLTEVFRPQPLGIHFPLTDISASGHGLTSLDILQQVCRAHGT